MNEPIRQFCIYCGMPLPPEAAVCPQCGQEVEKDAGVFAAVPPQGAPQTAPDAAAQEAAPQPATEPAEQAPQTEQAAPEAEPSTEAAPPNGQAPEAEQTPPTPKYMPGGTPPPAQGAANTPPAYGYAPPYGQEAYPGWQPFATPPLRLGSCVGTLVVAFLPLVGWIMLLIWGFSSTVEPNRRTLARALLIFKAILVALRVLLLVVVFVLAVRANASSFVGMSGYYY